MTTTPLPNRYPGFRDPVPDDGYRWWYLDGLSDCGQHAVTVIFFIGSVFSAHYAAARRAGPTRPIAHAAVNVALYGQPARWVMTERSEDLVKTTPERLTIGRSQMLFGSDDIRMVFDERATPLPRPVRGEIRLIPELLSDQEHCLDAHGRHHWWPYCPRARIELRFSKPDLRWTGSAYLDTNRGQEPLENGFRAWNWSRQSMPDNSVWIRYDRTLADDSEQLLGLRLDEYGSSILDTDAPELTLPKTPIWRIPRSTRLPVAQAPRVLKTLEDTPFYSRSILATNGAAHAFHESVSLHRFTRPWVQRLLPFRNPRSDRY